MLVKRASINLPAACREKRSGRCKSQGPVARWQAGVVRRWSLFTQKKPDSPPVIANYHCKRAVTDPSTSLSIRIAASLHLFCIFSALWQHNILKRIPSGIQLPNRKSMHTEDTFKIDIHFIPQPTVEITEASYGMKFSSVDSATVCLGDDLSLLNGRVLVCPILLVNCR